MLMGKRRGAVGRVFRLALVMFCGAFCSVGAQKAMAAEAQVIPGRNHTVAIKDNGTLWAWGRTIKVRLAMEHKIMF